MKQTILILVIALGLFGLGYHLGRRVSAVQLRVCRDDLRWAVDRGVKSDAALDLCRQGK